MIKYSKKNSLSELDEKFGKQSYFIKNLQRLIKKLKRFRSKIDQIKSNNKHLARLAVGKKWNVPISSLPKLSSSNSSWQEIDPTNQLIAKNGLWQRAVGKKLSPPLSTWQEIEPATQHLARSSVHLSAVGNFLSRFSYIYPFFCKAKLMVISKA